MRAVGREPTALGLLASCLLVGTSPEVGSWSLYHFARGSSSAQKGGELGPILPSPEADLSPGSLPVRGDTSVPGVLPQGSPCKGSFPAPTSPPLPLSRDPCPPKPGALQGPSGESSASLQLIGK